MNTKDKLKRVSFNLLNIVEVGAMWTVYISLDSSVVVLPFQGSRVEFPVQPYNLIVLVHVSSFFLSYYNIIHSQSISL